MISAAPIINRVSMLEREILKFQDVKEWYEDRQEASKKATQENINNPEPKCTGYGCP